MSRFYEERWELEGTLIAIQTHVGEVIPSIEHIKPSLINGCWIFEHPFGGLPWISKERQTMKHYYINIEEDKMFKGEEEDGDGYSNEWSKDFVKGICAGQDKLYAKEPYIDKQYWEQVGGGKYLNDLISEQRPTGLPGWVCPVCGRGNAPHVSTCPCVPLPPMQVTC